jgi:hypothetical protein
VSILSSITFIAPHIIFLIIYRAMVEAKHKAERVTHVTKWLKIYNISTLFALVNKQKQHSKVFKKSRNKIQWFDPTDHETPAGSTNNPLQPSGFKPPLCIEPQT